MRTDRASAIRPEALQSQAHTCVVSTKGHPRAHRADIIGPYVSIGHLQRLCRVKVLAPELLAVLHLGHDDAGHSETEDLSQLRAGSTDDNIGLFHATGILCVSRAQSHLVGSPHVLQLDPIGWWIHE